jgi:hypothetical protein
MPDLTYLHSRCCATSTILMTRARTRVSTVRAQHHRQRCRRLTSSQSATGRRSWSSSYRTSTRFVLRGESPRRTRTSSLVSAMTEWPLGALDRGMEGSGVTVWVEEDTPTITTAPEAEVVEEATLRASITMTIVAAPLKAADNSRNTTLAETILPLLVAPHRREAAPSVSPRERFPLPQRPLHHLPPLFRTFSTLMTMLSAPLLQLPLLPPTKLSLPWPRSPWMVCAYLPRDQTEQSLTIGL